MTNPIFIRLPYSLANDFGLPIDPDPLGPIYFAALQESVSRLKALISIATIFPHLTRFTSTPVGIFLRDPTRRLVKTFSLQFRYAIGTPLRTAIPLTPLASVVSTNGDRPAFTDTYPFSSVTSCDLPLYTRTDANAEREDTPRLRTCGGLTPVKPCPVFGARPSYASGRSAGTYANQTGGKRCQ